MAESCSIHFYRKPQFLRYAYAGQCPTCGAANICHSSSLDCCVAAEASLYILNVHPDTCRVFMSFLEFMGVPPIPLHDGSGLSCRTAAW